MNSLIRILAAGSAVLCTLILAGCAKPSEEPEAPAATDATGDGAQSAVADVPRTTFADAESAASALVEALRTPDREALAGMFGIDLDEFVPREDVDRADVEKFIAAYDESHELLTDTPGKAVLAVGADSWAFPIPIAEDGGTWAFDLEAGREEMTIRRIGRNELAAIQTVLAYCDAQYEYAQKDRNGDGLLEYAQKVLSSEGQRDGLYWPGEGADLSPLGPALDEAVAGEPYHGYRYRILTGQGPNAAGGARSYILGSRMSGGFGLIAWPAVYGDTGIMTFMVNHDGVVYEKDLGDDTESAAAAITAFDPDDSWRAAKPEA